MKIEDVTKFLEKEGYSYNIFGDYVLKKGEVTEFEIYSSKRDKINPSQTLEIYTSGNIGIGK